MSKLDQPLRLKHGIAAVAAALTLGVAGTAIAGGAGQKDAIRANVTTAGSAGGGSLAYRSDSRRVNANSQAYERVRCPRGTHVLGGGVESSADFSNQAGMMINSSNPIDLRIDDNPTPDDGWEGAVDVFANAGGERIKVYAICRS